MKIRLTSVLVDDQEKALDFYTRLLGFVKKTDVPMGEVRWLTVVSPDEPDGAQLLLEPNLNPAAMAYQQALFDQGITLTAFASDDVRADYARLAKLGVVFRIPPTNMGPVTMAVFEDTCGNLIQIFQV